MTVAETIGYIVLGALIIIGGALLFMFPTMWLWNWLMPSIFGLRTINLWESLGLLLLTGFLFRSSSSSKD